MFQSFDDVRRYLEFLDQLRRDIRQNRRPLEFQYDSLDTGTWLDVSIQTPNLVLRFQIPDLCGAVTPARETGQIGRTCRIGRSLGGSFGLLLDGVEWVYVVHFQSYRISRTRVQKRLNLLINHQL